MNYLKQAFDAICKDAKEAKGFYVCLMEESPFYGGPEEGGWWGSDVSLVAYQWFATEEQAEAAKTAIEALAKELQEDSKKEYGEQCCREMDWLEARGLDADYLREPDGPCTYSVIMTEGLPENEIGCRQYS